MYQWIGSVVLNCSLFVNAVNRYEMKDCETCQEEEQKHLWDSG
jgi:hypothetical protein